MKEVNIAIQIFLLDQFLLVINKLRNSHRKLTTDQCLNSRPAIWARASRWIAN